MRPLKASGISGWRTVVDNVALGRPFKMVLQVAVSHGHV